MKRLWQWVGSPSYWKLIAIMHTIFLTIATLGKTGDWMFATAMLLGFYFCWKLSAEAVEAAQRTWVGLTDEDRWEIILVTERDDRSDVMELTEAKLKEKNT